MASSQTQGSANYSSADTTRPTGMDRIVPWPPVHIYHAHIHLGGLSRATCYSDCDLAHRSNHARDAFCVVSE